MSDHGLFRSKPNEVKKVKKVRLGSAPTGQHFGLPPNTEHDLEATRQAIVDLKREFRATEKRLRSYGKEKSQPPSTEKVFQGLDFLPSGPTDDLYLHLRSHGPRSSRSDDAFGASVSQFSITHSDLNSRATWIGPESGVAASDVESVSSAKTFTLVENVDNVPAPSTPTFKFIDAVISAVPPTPTFKFIDAVIPAVPPTPAIARLMLADLTKNMRPANWVTVQGQDVNTQVGVPNALRERADSNSGPLASKSHTSIWSSGSQFEPSTGPHPDPWRGRFNSKSQVDVTQHESVVDPEISTAHEYNRPILIRKSVRLTNRQHTAGEEEAKFLSDEENKIIIENSEPVILRKTMKFVDNFKQDQEVEVAEFDIPEEDLADALNAERGFEEILQDKPVVMRNKVVIDPQTILCGYPGFCDVRSLNRPTVCPTNKPVTKQKSSKRKSTTTIQKMEEHTKKIPKPEHEYGERKIHTITPTTWKEERRELQERRQALQKESKKDIHKRESKQQKESSPIGTTESQEVTRDSTQMEEIASVPEPQLKVSQQEKLKVLQDDILKILQVDSVKVASETASLDKSSESRGEWSKVLNGDDSSKKRDKSPSKSRHYDVEQTREFMEKQKQIRLKQQAEEKEKKKQILELKKKKMQALREKQLQLVKANLEKCMYKKESISERKEFYIGDSQASEVAKSHAEDKLHPRKLVVPVTSNIPVGLQLPNVALPVPQLRADGEMDKKFKMMTESLNLDLAKTQLFLNNPSQRSSVNLTHSPPVKLEREPSSHSRNVSNVLINNQPERKQSSQDKNLAGVNGESTHSNIMSEVYSELQKMSLHTEKLQNKELTKQFQAINNDLLETRNAQNFADELISSKAHNNLNTVRNQSLKTSTRPLVTQPSYPGRVDRSINLASE